MNRDQLPTLADNYYMYVYTSCLPVQCSEVCTLAPCMASHTLEYDYKGHDLALTAVTLYYTGVGHSPSLSIIIIYS